MSEFDNFDYFIRYIQNEIKNEFILILKWQNIEFIPFKEVARSVKKVVSETLKIIDVNVN